MVAGYEQQPILMSCLPATTFGELREDFRKGLVNALLECGAHRCRTVGPRHSVGSMSCDAGARHGRAPREINNDTAHPDPRDDTECNRV